MDDRRYVADDMDEEVALPGFRFHPTDEELVGFYLRRRVEERSMYVNHYDIIQQTDLYRFDPWVRLPIEPSTVGEKEWYFFSNINRGRGMYRSSTRITQNGYWKATEMDKPIYSSGRSTLIGFKRSLAFYRAGTPAAGKSRKTDWTMHEFRLPEAETIDHTCRPPDGLHEPKTDSWIICKIFRARTSICHNSWERKYEHSSEPMQDHIDWRMLYYSSFRHFDPSSNSNRDRNANEGATLGAIKEPFDESEIKREENVLETRIDIDHSALAAKMRPMIWATDPNPSSADSLYTVIAAILAITGQAAFTLISMSNLPTLNCVGASTVVGFLGTFSAMLLRDRLPKVARYLGKVSVVIGAAAVVVSYASRFHSDLSWSWGVICGFALLIPSVAVIFA